MSDNEIISEARGECPLSANADGVTDCKNKCPIHRTFEKQYNCEKENTEYDSWLSAWTPELYQWIEDEGLAYIFAFILVEMVDTTTSADEDLLSGWQLIKTTPAEKAKALAKAIEKAT